MTFRSFIQLSLSLICANAASHAVDAASSTLWEDLPQQSLLARQASQRPHHFRALRINETALVNTLQRIPHENDRLAQQGEIMELPLPDGRLEHFEIHETDLMAPELAAKFPSIKTYVGRGIQDPTATLRMDRTPHGLHAQILSSSGAVYIDPITQGDTEQVVVYNKRDYPQSTEGFYCSVNSSHIPPSTSARSRTAARTGSELRTYRLACAVTGEYTEYHDGTVEGGLAAVVTTINRVTGVYEVELAIRLQLVAGNDQLIYADPDNDPYDNDNPIDQNQENIDTIIGNANYDIGHVFSTGAGGLAALGSVGVDDFKAEGMTGINDPIGDPFDIDYVAHEIGHQFGANHTFNGDSGSCADDNRNGSTAYEPGSGSTIMAYAAICGDDDLQGNSDPYFHSASLDEILIHVDDVIPDVGTRASTDNAVPSADAGNDYTIPARTPFELTASGSDTDGNDSLTYNWEQRDLGAQQDVNGGDNGSGPLFRSWLATPSPSRTFPRLSDLLNRDTVIGETLPTTTRSMNFRVTVRDNEANGGGVNTDDMIINVIDTGETFRVTAPSAAEEWPAQSTQTVTWDVAGTDANGIDSTHVTIQLTTDDGTSYTTLLASTENDGSQAITIPENLSNNARIRVQGANNIFFNLSDRFTISEVAPEFTIRAASAVQSICPPSHATYTIETEAQGDFTETITLSIDGEPDGSTATFSPNPVTPGASSTLTISNTDSIAADIYLLQIDGNGGDLNDNLELSLEVSAGLPAQVLLTSPTQGTTDVPVAPRFIWAASAQAKSYRLEVDEDPTFNSPTAYIETDDTSAILNGLLNEDTPYYWRVIATNICGSTTSDYFYLTTATTQAPICNSPAVAIPDNDADGISDTIMTSQTGTLSDLDVSVNISHTHIGDLTLELHHVDTGTTVTLVHRPGTIDSGSGSSANNINVILDDEAATTAEDSAPYRVGNRYRPNDSLSAFDGESLAGEWKLTVKDRFQLDIGSLHDWCLMPTITPSSTNYPFLSISDLTTAEDLENAVIQSTLSAPFDSDIAFDYATSSGTASEGDDFQATSDTLTIPADELSGTIRIPLTNDDAAESAETFTLLLSAPSNVILPDNQITITIIDDSTPLMTWLDNFGLNLSHLNEDSDADGLTNLLEYGFNLDPTENARIAYDPSASVDADGPLGVPAIKLDDSATPPRLQIIYPRRKASSDSSLTYSGGFSSDLVTWSEETPDDVIDIDDTWEQVTINEPETPAPNGKRFGKVELTSE